MNLSTDELTALLSLIEYHDDWDEVSEIVGADVPQLYDKLHTLLQESTDD